jgi:Tfp pilus assembly PilM family ATPase
VGSLNFYHDEPLFGLDIGHSNLKVMQLDINPGTSPKVLGYGVAAFPEGSMTNGVVVNYSALSHALYELFTKHMNGKDTQGIDLLMMATPRNIVDSYVKLLNAIGLEPVALEPTMNATSRLFGLADPSHGTPSLLVDFGSISVDMAAFDKIMFVNSTIAGGSDNITQLISKYLGVPEKEAYDPNTALPSAPSNKKS